MSSSTRLIVSILLVAGAAIAFWTMALSPKREEADELATKAGQLQVTLSEARASAAAAEAARREFPSDYRQLVVLGQAVPAGDETSSLLVELNSIAAAAGVKFGNFQLESGGGETASASAPAPAPEAAPAAPSAGAPSGAVPASTTIPPTEAAASLLPLGASIGTAGLGVMPYSLTFSGDFFEIADFIKGIDSLVRTGTGESKLGVNGRLITLDGFALNTDSEDGASDLRATFAVTTYLTPPTQGITAGATSAAPAPVTAATGTEAAPAESPATTTSETVSAR